MTQTPSIKKSVRKRAQAASAMPDIDAQARLFAEIAADCSRGIFPGDYSEGGISAFAAEVATLWRETEAKRAAWSEADWALYRKIAEDESKWQSQTAPASSRRRPSISKTIAQAEKATGKTVASITTPDGTTLRFGEPEPTEATNPWLADLDKAKQ